MMSGKFNYNDLLKQMKMVKRMGKFSGLLKMLPGMSTMANVDQIDDRQLLFIEAIIGSMTPQERTHPELIERSSSRRNRVARGSGRSTTEVNRLVSTLEKQQKMMQRFQNMDPNNIQNMAQGGFQPRETRAMRRAKKKKR